MNLVLLARLMEAKMNKVYPFGPAPAHSGPATKAQVMAAYADSIRLELSHASLSVPTLVSNTSESDQVTTELVLLNNRISDLLDKMLDD